MDLQLLPVKGQTTVARIRQANTRNQLLLFIVVFITVLGLTPLLTWEGLTLGVSLLLGTVVAVVIAAAIVRWPTMGLFGIVTCAVLIEQNQISPAPPITNYLYVFYWPQNLSGLPERPIGFLMLFILFMFICHRFMMHRPGLKGGALLLPFLFYLACVAFGVVHGMTSGGNFKIIVLEIRPFWYLFVSYLLAYNLVARKSHITTFFWIVIVAAGVKALQGVYIYVGVLHFNLSQNREIMAHEDSFFFAALIFIVILFALHYRHKAQLYTALAIMPMLLVAMIANQRRTDYIALLVACAVAWALLFMIRPEKRRQLLIVGIICAAIGTTYVLIFQHASGALGSPARSIVSIFHPDPNDASSNLYRQIEDYDLKFTVKQNPLGLGFGKQFSQPQILPNILDLDPYYLYIPHNTVYWIWMRLGWIGYFALWYLIGSFIIIGCLTVRRLKDPYLQLVAIYIVGVTFMEVIVAYADYQFYFYRNVIYLGLLMGMMLKLPGIDEEESRKKQQVEEKKGRIQTYEAARGVPQPAPASVGR